MSSLKNIKTALISVYYKDKLDSIVKTLDKLSVHIYSTGGTLKFIEDLGVKAESVENLTSYPSILGGRVKTLHPKVFGGILARRDNENDQFQIQEYEIPEIDLVIVDLYPFEETVASGATDSEIIEKIDIGGVSLIRAAAKNHKDVVIVASRNQYENLLDILQTQGGATSIEDRRKFAAQAFDITSHYDTAIFKYFNGELPDSSYKLSVQGAKGLRYGENPHQKGIFYGKLDEIFEQLHGKEISYNNLLDIDAAVSLISEFENTTIAILKHNNACGLATRPSLTQAWVDALAGDPVSAYGGVIISNKMIDIATAEEMNKLFFEVIIAPGYHSDALPILCSKKNRIILIQKKTILPKYTNRTLLNGILVQERDASMETEKEMKPVTEKTPSNTEIKDLIFANKIVKHSKSNAIVLAKNEQLIASGVGQTSRVDALKHSIEKAKSFNFDLKGVVLASDAFFPFADSVEIAYNAGVTAIVQPGGSVKDQESIDFCNKNKISMVFTGIRHFKH